MESIDINNTFYNITKDNEQLKIALIDFGFKPMENKMNYLSVGKIITLDKALKNIDKTVEQLNIYLEENNIEVKFYG